MATGTVKRIPNVKNYGFIIAQDNPSEELFFHRTVVAGDGFDDLRPGQSVQFEVVSDPRNAGKRQAINVTPVER